MIVVFPNSAFSSQANAQANAGTLLASLWDFLRTLGRLREAAQGEYIPRDDISDAVDVGDGIHVPHDQLPTPNIGAVVPHPTVAKYAVTVLPLFLLLVDVNNADTTIAARATRIRTALCSGATITRPSDGATIANSFWTVDQTTTRTRWNRLALALGTAVELTDDWRPAAP